MLFQEFSDGAFPHKRYTRNQYQKRLLMSLVTLLSSQLLR